MILVNRPGGCFFRFPCGTVGGHGSAFASCAEPLRSVYTCQASQTASLNPQKKTLPAQLVATAPLLQAVRSCCAEFTPVMPAKGKLEPQEKGHGNTVASCAEPLLKVYTFQRCQTARLNLQEKTLPAQLVATAALVQGVRSRCAGFTPFRPAKRQA